MSATAEYMVRPGDRWDGARVTFERDGVDFTTATVECTLHRFPGGPQVYAFQPSLTLADGSLEAVFVMEGTHTRSLVFGQTYHGLLRVTVPNETPGAEPAFGPVTIHTWTLEAVDHPVLADQDVVDASLTGGVVGPTGPQGPQGPAGADGADGAGFELGADLYIHPTSGNLYMFISPNYYRGTPTLVDGIPTIAWDTVGTSDPT